MAQRSGLPESMRGSLEAYAPTVLFQRGEKGELFNAVRLRGTCGRCGFQLVHVEPWPAGWSDGVTTELHDDWEPRMDKAVAAAEAALESAHTLAHPDCDVPLQFLRL